MTKHYRAPAKLVPAWNTDRRDERCAAYVPGEEAPVKRRRAVLALSFIDASPARFVATIRGAYTMSLMATAPSSAASIIVPAFREAPNIEPLVERAFAATQAAGIDAELIIVDDDSKDGTDAAIERLKTRFPVRLIVRKGERGLSSAVLAGFGQARFDRFVVLDADLQHPPEAIPELIRRLDEPGCDFAIATRYGGEGGVDSDWPLYRHIGSTVATLLARPLAPLSDPMSGFFALHRSTWRRAARLDPVGYKIALELYVKCRCRNPAEVPIRFAARSAGTSKAGITEGVRYLRHLLRLYRFRFPLVVAAAVVIVVAVVVSLVWAVFGGGPDKT